MAGTKTALVAGIDNYGGGYPALQGCCSDARALETVLSRDDRDKKDFAVEVLCDDGDDHDEVTRYDLRQKLAEALDNAAGHNFVFTFSGHGNYHPSYGLELVCFDGEGLAFSEVLTAIHNSQMQQATVFLDCCFSGAAGSIAAAEHLSMLRRDVSVLAATRPLQTAEEDGLGVFTRLLVEGLNGGAADLTGRVTVPLLFNYILSALPANRQQPVLRSNVDLQHPIRELQPPVPKAKLDQLASIFDKKDEYVLKAADVALPAGRARRKRLEQLKELHHFGLIRCEQAGGIEDLAEAGATVELTPLGRHARGLVRNNAI